jgi:hypothetical protein
MKPPVLLTRDQFRERVFARDGHKCVVCGAPAVDAHHILERKLWQGDHEKGGYFEANGASLCAEHHIKAETTEIDAQDLRDLIGITQIVLPEHLYEDQRYDKWSNPILANGQRIRGELFHDESVQKILAKGGMLDRFTHIVRAPRTYHLPWSAGLHDDDKMMKSLAAFEGERVIVSSKWDGENTSIYRNAFHARSPDGRSHPSRDRVKAWAATIQHDIPEQWRLGGENLYARHSIAYENLQHYFFGFHMWNDKNECLSWDETLEWFELLGVIPVPVLYDGIFNEKAIKALYDEKRDWNTKEGYVVRIARKFAMAEYPRVVGKYVRRNHISHNKHHWQSQKIIPNGLAKDAII